VFFLFWQVDICNYSAPNRILQASDAIGQALTEGAESRKHLADS